MKLRIMVTGKNRRIASDICEHLQSDRDYPTIKCPATKSALLEMVLSEMPHVIIICCGGESKDTVKVFDILKEATKGGFTRIMVVANEEDRKIFIGETMLERMFFIDRPVSLTSLYWKIEEFEKAFEAYEEKELSTITEYVNENAKETFERKHILVVDDDPEQLAMIKEHLKEFYEVTLVNSGKNVLRMLERYKIDLILLDYIMPEMDGPAVLGIIRSYPEYAEIPIVFLTGVSERETVTKTLVELKPKGYVLKPAKKSEIVAKIIDVLG